MTEHSTSGGHPLPSVPGETPGLASGPQSSPLGPVLLEPRSRSAAPASAGARGGPLPPVPPVRYRGGEPSSEPSGSAARGPVTQPDGQASPGSGATTRKRRRRGGRRRTSKNRRPEPAAADTDAPGQPAAEAVDKAPARKRRKRGSRGGRGRRKKTTAVEIEFIPGEEDELPELAVLPAEAVLVHRGEEAADRGPARTGRRPRTKKARAEQPRAGRAKTKTEPRQGQRGRNTRVTRANRAAEEASVAPAADARAKRRLILVNARDPEETRVAVVEDGRIAELQMTVKKHVSFVNDIYRGRVVNLEPAIGAAFVDFGQGRNGFLHASDVLPSYGQPDWDLEKLLSTPVEPDELGKDGEDADGAEKATSNKGSGAGKKKSVPKKKPPAKLPPEKVDPTKDTQEAAAKMLRRLFNRG